MSVLLNCSKIIRNILIQEGFCSATPSDMWGCVRGGVPDGPGTNDNMVGVVDREDVSVGRWQANSSYQVNPHLQILVRGVGHDKSSDKVREIALFLDEISNGTYTTEIDAVVYRVLQATRTQNIQYHGTDASGRRNVWSIEYDFVIVEEPAEP